MSLLLDEMCVHKLNRPAPFNTSTSYDLQNIELLTKLKQSAPLRQPNEQFAFRADLLSAVLTIVFSEYNVSGLS